MTHPSRGALAALIRPFQPDCASPRADVFRRWATEWALPLLLVGAAACSRTAALHLIYSVKVSTACLFLSLRPAARSLRR